ncbi:MAG: hypothetical protein SFU83_24410 [Meiothermus sp.]|nr:hypothetical protein [Meiothermus sp.]
MATRWLMVILASLIVPGAAALDPPSGSWVRVGESAHFRYYEPSDYQNTPRALTRAQVSIALLRLEVFWELVAPSWDYPKDAQIAYYKFATTEDLHRLTGRKFGDKAASGQGMVFSVHASDPHELAHVLFSPATDQLADFWLEGLARAYAWPWLYCPADRSNCSYQTRLGAWNLYSVHYWAQAALRRGALPRLEELIYGNTRFDQLPLVESYPVAGSFVSFLLDNPGKVQRLKGFLRQSGSARSSAEVLAAFEVHWGQKLSEAETQWRGFLETWNEAALK